MQNLTQPTLLLKPFAENGQRNTIPENATGTNLASLDEGFPPVTGQNPRDGGVPPTRLDFNGLGHLTTTYDYFYQAGGCFTFNQVVSNAIGGYPLNARLWYLNENGESSVLRSTKANNTDNFLTDPSVIGDSWVYDVATTTYVKDEINEIRTNCITEIPQDIKLELNNGVLTLKAGTKYYTPNGSVYQLVSDESRVISSKNAFVVILLNKSDYSFSQVYEIDNNKTCSGATDALSGTPRHLWYDTTNNIIKYIGNDGVSDQYYAAFPLGLASGNGSIVTSIDQVFNGFGYIGSTAFVLPNVKGLIPNGRNADGTLKNIAFTVNNVLTTTDTSGATGGLEYYFNSSGIYRDNFGTVIYDEVNNKFTGAATNVVLLDPNAYRTGGKVTSFNPKNTFRAVDYNDFKKLDDEAVKTTGNQTITGPITLTASLRGTTTSAAHFGGYSNQSSAITKGTAPSANCGTVFSLQDSTNIGSSSGRIAALDLRYSQNKDSYAQLMAFEPVLNSTNSASIRITYPASGNPYTTAPTPPSATDNSTKIATTSWVANHRCKTPATTTSTASVNAPAYVVENYYNSSTGDWYRVWSDGWIEQGGVEKTDSTYTATGTITLLKAFSTDRYCITLCGGYGTTNNANVQGYFVHYNMKTSAFSWGLKASSNYFADTMLWYACGY